MCVTTYTILSLLVTLINARTYQHPTPPPIDDETKVIVYDPSATFQSPSLLRNNQGSIIDSFITSGPIPSPGSTAMDAFMNFSVYLEFLRQFATIFNNFPGT